MSLEIDNDPATERVKETVEDAIRGALGERVDIGTWRVMLRRLPRGRGFLVDLNNMDGVSRQWIFEDASDPIALTIRRDLKPAP
jgi:hypothetical protein